jgi:hypothetical protein
MLIFGGKGVSVINYILKLLVGRKHFSMKLVVLRFLYILKDILYVPFPREHSTF